MTVKQLRCCIVVGCLISVPACSFKDTTDLRPPFDRPVIAEEDAPLRPSVSASNETAPKPDAAQQQESQRPATPEKKPADAPVTGVREDPLKLAAPIEQPSSHSKPPPVIAKKNRATKPPTADKDTASKLSVTPARNPNNPAVAARDASDEELSHQALVGCSIPPQVVLGGTSTAVKEFRIYAPELLYKGTGLSDRMDYLPDMRFPIGRGAAHAGTHAYLPYRDCSAARFQRPWQNTFCELRGEPRDASVCPGWKRDTSPGFHAGVDLTVADSVACCDLWRLFDSRKRDSQIEIVAADAGIVEGLWPGGMQQLISKRSKTETKQWHIKYLHLDFRKIGLKVGDKLEKGQVIGYLWNDFWQKDAKKKWVKVKASMHLHFELLGPLADQASPSIPKEMNVSVSPYVTLIYAYARDRNLTPVEVSQK